MGNYEAPIGVTVLDPRKLVEEIECLRQAVLDEREACAKLCDETAKSLDDDGLPTMAYGARYSATAIRARGRNEIILQSLWRLTQAGNVVENVPRHLLQEV